MPLSWILLCLKMDLVKTGSGSKNKVGNEVITTVLFIFFKICCVSLKYLCLMFSLGWGFLCYILGTGRFLKPGSLSACDKMVFLGNLVFSLFSHVCMITVSACAWHCLSQAPRSTTVCCVFGLCDKLPHLKLLSTCNLGLCWGWKRFLVHTALLSQLCEQCVM